MADFKLSALARKTGGIVILIAIASFALVACADATTSTSSTSETEIRPETSPVPDPTTTTVPQPAEPTPTPFIPAPELQPGVTELEKDPEFAMTGSGSAYAGGIVQLDGTPTAVPPEPDEDNETSTEKSTEAEEKPDVDKDDDSQNEENEEVELPFPPTVGDPAPEFVLPSVSHGEISLQDYASERPVVLVFYRAYWCPPCRTQLNELRANYQEFTDAGAEVIALSTDDLGPTRQLAERQGYEFPILYTSGSPTVPASYDRFNKFGDGLASAAIFIIGTDGRIEWQELGTGIYHFTRASTIIGQLEDL